MSPQACWILQEEVVPRLRAVIPRSVRCVGSEDAEELIQDATVIAARMIISAEKNQKKFGGSNIAYYTLQHLKSGRRANGTSSVDVLATATQLNGSTRLNSLEETVATDESGNEIFELHDLLSTDREDPSMQAARKMDWDAFCRGLSDLERLVVEYLSGGRTLRDVARLVGLSDSAMQGYRRKIAIKVQEFMGADILEEIAVMPRWRDGLNADRELLACRQERRALA
jgi:hypothetical protein